MLCRSRFFFRVRVREMRKIESSLAGNCANKYDRRMEGCVVVLLWIMRTSAIVWLISHVRRRCRATKGVDALTRGRRGRSIYLSFGRACWATVLCDVRRHLSDLCDALTNPIARSVCFVLSPTQIDVLSQLSAPTDDDDDDTEREA